MKILMIITTFGTAGSFYLFDRNPDLFRFFLFLGWANLFLSNYFAFLILVDSNVPYKIASFLSKILYEEAAIAHAISGMSDRQLDIFSARMVFSPNASVIEYKGVQLNSDFIIRELQKATEYFPEYPPVREYDPHSAKIKKPDEVKRKVLRDFLRASGRLEERSGQTDRWINGWSPDQVLEYLGYIDE